MTRRDQWWGVGAVIALAAIVTGWPTGGAVHGSESLRVRQTLLLNASTLGTSAAATPGTVMEQCREVGVYIEWGAGVNGGAVIIESAYTDDYAGTWAPLTTVDASGASRADIVQITGIHRALRTRISDAITGGSVTTRVVCN